MRVGIRPWTGGLAAGALVLGTLTACSPMTSVTSVDAPAVSEQAAAPEKVQAEAQTNGAQPRSAEPSVSPAVPAKDTAEPAGADAAQPLKQAPKSLPVSGTVLMLHAEAHEQVSAEARAEVAADPSSDAPVEGASAFDGGAILATDDDQMIPLGSDVVGEEIETGQRFEGQVALSAEGREALQRKIDAEGSVSHSAALEELSAVAEQSGDRLAVSGEAFAAPAESAAGAEGLGASSAAVAAARVKSKWHTAHVFYFKNKKKRKGYGKKSLTRMVKSTGSYWKSQTNGKVRGIKVKKFLYTKKKFNYCNTGKLWSYAAKRFKKKPSYFTKKGRHLVVYVDSGCGDGKAGLGIIGSLHKGGLIWVDLAYKSRTNLANPNSAVKTTGFNVTAHEIGHNMGLGHAQARVCSPYSSGMSGSVDSGVSWKRDPGVGGFRSLRATGVCADVEYGDWWNVMGSSSTVNPPALGTAQKWALGVVPNGAVRSVSASGGAQQTFTLKPAGTSSGLRGLKVNGGKSGTFFVEYRNSTGWDAGWGLVGADLFNAVYRDNTGTGMMNNGVQVLKSYPTSKHKRKGKWRKVAYKRSSAIMARQSFGPGYEGQARGLAQGRSLRLYGGAVTITTVSMTPTQAVVRVTYN